MTFPVRRVLLQDLLWGNADSAEAVPRRHAAQPEVLSVLRAALKQGAIVAIPTESSYGLAVDPRSRAGVEAVFRLKGRAADQPLPVVVANPAQAIALGIRPQHPLWQAALPRWPAPLTVVVEADQQLPAQCGEATLAVRIPRHAGLLQLLVALGFGLTATSANRSGAPPLLEAESAAELLAPQGGWVVDCGLLEGGPPSTVVAWNVSLGAPVVLRQGAVPFP